MRNSKKFPCANRSHATLRLTHPLSFPSIFMSRLSEWESVCVCVCECACVRAWNNLISFCMFIGTCVLVVVSSVNFFCLVILSCLVCLVILSCLVCLVIMFCLVCRVFSPSSCLSVSVWLFSLSLSRSLALSRSLSGTLISFTWLILSAPDLFLPHPKEFVN